MHCRYLKTGQEKVHILYTVEDDSALALKKLLLYAGHQNSLYRGRAKVKDFHLFVIE